MAYARPAIALLDAPAATSTCCSGFYVAGTPTYWRTCAAGIDDLCVLGTGFCG